MERRDGMKHWLISTNYKRRLVDNEFTRPARFHSYCSGSSKLSPTLFLRHLLGIWEFAGFDMKNYAFQKIDVNNSSHQYSAPFKNCFIVHLNYSQAQNINTFRKAFSKHFLNGSFSVFCLSLWTLIPQKAVYIYRTVFPRFLSIILANLWLFRVPICSCVSLAQFILSSAVSTALKTKTTLLPRPCLAWC